MRFQHPEFDSNLLHKSVFDILEHNTLLALATIRDATSYINTAYYSYREDLTLYILTEPSSQHCRNLGRNPSVAVAIYDSHQSFTNPKRGLQLFGRAYRTPSADEAAVLANYSRRFPALADVVRSTADFEANVINSRLYTIEIDAVQVFDEVAVAADRFLLLELHRD